MSIFYDPEDGFQGLLLGLLIGISVSVFIFGVFYEDPKKMYCDQFSEVELIRVPVVCVGYFNGK
jgi:hypothetical protein